MNNKKMKKLLVLFFIIIFLVNCKVEDMIDHEPVADLKITKLGIELTGWGYPSITGVLMNYGPAVAYDIKIVFYIWDKWDNLVDIGNIFHYADILANSSATFDGFFNDPIWTAQFEYVTHEMTWKAKWPE